MSPPSWSSWVLGVVAGLSIAAIPGLVVTYGRLTALEAHVSENAERLAQMELGKTTPMAEVTKQRFEAVDQRLRAIENRLERLADMLHALRGVDRKKATAEEPLGKGPPPADKEVGG